MTEAETTDTSLIISRTFDAPRERVYRAFTDPDELEQWYTPGDATPHVRALELESDGAFSVSFIDGENRTDIDGAFVEVVENERLVHTWRYPGEGESQVTIEFEDVEDGTEVVLTHENIDSYRELSNSENADGYAKGWTSALTNLEEAL